MKGLERRIGKMCMEDENQCQWTNNVEGRYMV